MPKPVKTAQTPPASETPWWLVPGEEDCPHCEHTYSYHLEARCFECDAPICPMCIVRIDERRLCPECSAQRKAE